MKLIASLLTFAVLSSASTIAAHASTIAPGINLNLISGTTNYSFVQTTPGTFTAADGLNSVTAVYLNTGVADVFSVTEVCATIGLTPCKGYTFTIADANAAAVSVGVGLSAAALADTTLTTNLATLKGGWQPRSGHRNRGVCAAGPECHAQRCAGAGNAGTDGHRTARCSGCGQAAVLDVRANAGMVEEPTVSREAPPATSSPLLPS